MSAERIVREIARDRRRGATALAERALDALAFSRSVVPRLIGLRAMPSCASPSGAAFPTPENGFVRAREALFDRLVGSFLIAA